MKAVLKLSWANVLCAKLAKLCLVEIVLLPTSTFRYQRSKVQLFMSFLGVLCG